MSEWTKGDLVAWFERRRGKTTGVSLLHRVYEDGRTYCLQPLPDKDHRWHGAFGAGLVPCKRCERLHAAEPSFAEVLSDSMAGVSQ